MSNSFPVPDLKATKPFSIRLTAAERQTLQLKAGTTPISHYVRSIILDGASATRATPRRAPLPDHKPLGKILALLGQSDLGPSLREMAGQAKAGTLCVDDATCSRLSRACEDVQNMRVLLMRSLGKQVDDRSPRLAEILAAAFQAAVDAGGGR